VLRDRLVRVTTAVRAQLERHPAPALVDIMGSEIDVLKLVSSMTLFREVARRLMASEPLADYAGLADAADAILRRAQRQGFAECRFTRDALGQ